MPWPDDVKPFSLIDEADARLHRFPDELSAYALAQRGLDPPDQVDRAWRKVRQFKTAGRDHAAAQRRAADWFARGLARFLPPRATCLTLPTSRADDDPRHDGRFEILADRLCLHRPDLDLIEGVLVRTQTHTALHEGGERSPESVGQGLTCLPFPAIGSMASEHLVRESQPPRTLFIIDDVCTTGSHLIAATRLLRTHAPGLPVVGLVAVRKERG